MLSACTELDEVFSKAGSFNYPGFDMLTLTC